LWRLRLLPMKRPGAVLRAMSARRPPGKIFQSGKRSPGVRECHGSAAILPAGRTSRSGTPWLPVVRDESVVTDLARCGALVRVRRAELHGPDGERGKLLFLRESIEKVLPCLETAHRLRRQWPCVRWILLEARQGGHRRKLRRHVTPETSRRTAPGTARAEPRARSGRTGAIV